MIILASSSYYHYRYGIELVGCMLAPAYMYLYAHASCDNSSDLIRYLCNYPVAWLCTKSGDSYSPFSIFSPTYASLHMFLPHLSIQHQLNGLSLIMIRTPSVLLGLTSYWSSYVIWLAKYFQLLHKQPPRLLLSYLNHCDFTRTDQHTNTLDPLVQS